MAGIKINRITNANVYMNGSSLLGRVDEASLPVLSMIEADVKALGLVGKITLPSGFDKLTGKFKWNSFYDDVWLQFGNPFVPVSVQVRSSVDTYNSQGRSAQTAMVTFLTLSMTKIPLGVFKQNDAAEFESDFTATYVRQTVGGKDIIELDVLANIFKVGGVDQLDIYRANIGG
ncbi:phage major tail tube protein [Paraburkholderia sp. BR14263]|uniref:phage major tail tube protein n=1 Tax=unclassified Paraburkholderia TaxID=2615204 RepID=UPI0034CDF442